MTYITIQDALSSILDTSLTFAYPVAPDDAADFGLYGTGGDDHTTLHWSKVLAQKVTLRLVLSIVLECYKPYWTLVAKYKNFWKIVLSREHV